MKGLFPLALVISLSKVFNVSMNITKGGLNPLVSNKWKVYAPLALVISLSKVFNVSMNITKGGNEISPEEIEVRFETSNF